MTLIEVYADVCCPFTHVGLRRLVEHRDAMGASDVVLRVNAWPLELVNGHPLDPPFIAEEVDEIREQVAPDLFRNFKVAAFPSSSIPAMGMVASGYAVSDRLGEQLSLAVRDALFEGGLDICEPEILANIAADHGWSISATPAEDEESVRQQWAEGMNRGVIGSPHFFLAQDHFFCPALDIKRVDGHLRISADAAAFERFLEAAIGQSDTSE
jgi:2-hydroxychromene-2-carboxylate isomerase